MIERDTTAGVMIDERGMYLVAQRKKGGALSEKWEFIGGKNRYGETLSETLEREWMEEVGVAVRVGEFLLNTDFVNNDTHYTLHCYRVSPLSANPSFSLTVHNDIRWVTGDEMKKLDFGPSDTVIRDYLVR